MTPHDDPDDLPPAPRRRRWVRPLALAALAAAGAALAFTLSTPDRRQAAADAVERAAAKAADTFKEPPGPQPTRGTLFIDGKPAKGAVVTFWPVPLETVTWRTVKPQAMVEADGSYRPNSYDLHDGAKPGEYLVTVLWTGPDGGPGPDLLKGKYADPKRPVLRVTIGLGDNVVEPLRLDGVTDEPKPEVPPEPKSTPKQGD